MKKIITLIVFLFTFSCLSTAQNYPNLNMKSIKKNFKHEHKYHSRLQGFGKEENTMIIFFSDQLAKAKYKPYKRYGERIGDISPRNITKKDMPKRHKYKSNITSMFFGDKLGHRSQNKYLKRINSQKI